MSLVLDFPTNQETTFTKDALITPLGMMSMLDHYSRCEVGELAAGLLLGVRSRVDQAKITMTIPLKFKDDSEIDMELLEQMATLYKQAEPSESVVGWYRFGKLDEVCFDINNQLRDLIDPFQPVILMVDVEKFGSEFPVAAFVPKPCKTLNSTSKGTMFLDIPYEMVGLENDSDACKGVINLVDFVKGSVGEGDLSRLRTQLESIQKLLSSMQEYVKAVLAKKQKSNSKIGKYLWSTLSEIPRIDPAVFRSVLQDHLLDLEMVNRLTTLTRKQLQLAEQLHSAF